LAQVGATVSHFISYSTVESEEFARRLGAALKQGSPTIDVWIDKQRLRPGEDWDSQIVVAIAECETFMFLMTADSVRDNSVCKREWIRALKYKKPIIPLLVEPGVDLPFQLDGRQWIDMSGDLDDAVSALRGHLVWLKSYEGKLRMLEYRRQDGYRDLLRADADKRRRVEQELKELEAEIRELELILEDESRAERLMTDRIEQGLARDRDEGMGGARRGPKVVNNPPAVPADSFQDRRWETELLAEFLRNWAVRLVVISGPESIGKTAMVCRLLQRTLAGDHLEGGPVPLDGVVYLASSPEHAVTVPVLRDSLGKLLPPDLASRLRDLFRDPKSTELLRLRELLTALGKQRIVVLLDELEGDRDSLQLHDEQLAEALRFLQNVEVEHGVTVVVTSRNAIAGLAGATSDTLRRLALDEGLPSPHAENVLRTLDADGTVGLRDAPATLLDRVRQLTGGNPMALESVYAILRADRHTSLPELLDEAATLPPEVVLEDFLLREAVLRLADRERQVVEALAVYQCLVRPDAVEDLLAPYRGPLDARPILDRLVELEIVRRQDDLYQLPASYWRHVLSRIPWEPAGDWEPDDPSYTQVTLFIRAARHFERAYRPTVARKQIGDIAAQLVEFDLWVRARQYDTAAWTLLQIDGEYLLPWGHAREVLERHKQLEGHVEDPELRQLSLGRIGVAYLRLGNHQQATAYFDQALELARTPGERMWWVTNLGSALFEEGKTAAALERYAEGLELARSAGDQVEEIAPLAGIALCYRELGDYRAAVEHNQEALMIAEVTGSLREKAERLEVAATLHAEVGELRLAEQRLEEALALAQGRGYRLIEASCLADRAEFLLDKGCEQEAADVAELALECGGPLGLAELTRQTNFVLALAHLRTGSLDRARVAADQAADCHPTRWRQPAAVLQGIVRLRDQDQEGAVDAFARGLSEAEDVLDLDGDRYPAHDAMGLGLLGLAMAGQRWQASAASAAFQAARRRTRAQGVVGRVLRLIDDMPARDQEGISDRVRAAARGEADDAAG
jgi:tetratricopeptide (TPR) repeat protein